jgi:hypothetical protein
VCSMCDMRLQDKLNIKSDHTEKKNTPVSFLQKWYLYTLTILFKLRRCLPKRFRVHSVHIQRNRNTKGKN